MGVAGQTKRVLSACRAKLVGQSHAAGRQAIIMASQVCPVLPLPLPLPLTLYPPLSRHKVATRSLLKQGQHKSGAGTSKEINWTCNLLKRPKDRPDRDTQRGRAGAEKGEGEGVGQKE